MFSFYAVSLVVLQTEYHLIPHEGSQIFKGDVQIPKWLSPGALNMIKRILEPNPKTRITMAMIKEDEWFKEGYSPTNPEDDEEDVNIDDDTFSIHEVVYF